MAATGPTHPFLPIDWKRYVMSMSNFPSYDSNPDGDDDKNSIIHHQHQHHLFNNHHHQHHDNPPYYLPEDNAANYNINNNNNDNNMTLAFDLHAALLNVNITNSVDLLSGLGLPDLDQHHRISAHHPPSLTQTFYAYFTPILIVIGVAGNTLSLTVFLSRTMRRLSASTYLSALSISDIAALIFHVLVDWIRRGAPSIGGGGGGQGQGHNSAATHKSMTSSFSNNFNHFNIVTNNNLTMSALSSSLASSISAPMTSATTSSSSSSSSIFDAPGMCQLQMYLSYVTRFLSAWIVVTFTLERYLGVCHPLKRKGMFFGSKSSRKIVFVLLIASLILSLYKPILTGSYEYRVFGGQVIMRCSRNPSYPMLSFVLDSIFAVSISLVPFCIISTLNSLTICRLRRRFKRNLRIHIITTESIVRMEFTIIFLIISFVFIALNVPFFCFWCHRFLMSFHGSSTLSSNDNWTTATYQNVFIVSRIMFYTNYAINFFLYSVSGACFRRQLKLMFVKRRGWGAAYNNNNSSFPRLMNHIDANTNSHQHSSSWL